MAEDNFYHEPVLKVRSIELLKGNSSSGVFVDATFGGGGHSVHLLSSVDSNARLVAFDQDKDALENISDDNRLIFVQSNFRYIQHYMEYLDLGLADGVLADLGVSSFQFDKIERGFSFRGEAKLDMRMNQLSTAINARDVLNTYDAKKLQSMFSNYGEVQFARSLADGIVQYRKQRSIDTTEDLVKMIMNSSKGKAKKKELAQVFQALRIEVNDEVNALKEFLLGAVEVLKPNGRLVVISYHSLEDRLVKNFFAKGVLEGPAIKDDYGKVIRSMEPLFRKPLVPNEEEMVMNSRSRSAKLRVGVKI